MAQVKVQRNRMKQARVTATVFIKKSHVPLAKVETTMGTDLPAHCLGEILCEAVNKAWADGNDPITFDVLVSFS